MTDKSLHIINYRPNKAHLSITIHLAQMDLFDNTAGHRGSRMLFWNEAGNLYTVADDAQFSYYVYDHEGHRTLKLTGSASQLDNNADRMHIHAALDDVTLYPSPYIVVTPHGYTKHYYAAGERIAARIGSGGLSHDTTCIMTDQTVTDLYNDLFDRCHKVSNERRNSGEPPSDLTDADGNPLPGIDRINFSDAPGALLSELEVYPIRFEDCMAAIAPEGGRPWDEPNVYFCHSDHLGSASWITNSHGVPVQHLRYLPYGEPFVNQRTSGYSERFTFTGKERDPETGYGYFGARYMDHDLMTMWLSVDPMADKYPSISPYAYCAWNPVKLVDPDGNDWYQKGNDYYWSDKVVSRNTTPEGCKYIGNDNSLYRHFGLPTNSVSQSLETSQTVQTPIGTNTESNNPYEPKYSASGTARAIAKTSIGYSIQKDENTGKLKGLSIHAKLETTVSDIGAGGYAAAILKVSCKDFDCSETFREKEEPALKSIDGCTHKYLNASVTVSARKLSANCFSKLQIKGYWFSNNRPMTIPFTLGIAPSCFKHTYINK